MSTTLILFIIIHLSTLIYFVELLRRIFIRTREYELKETRYTLPFGFLRLSHVVALYVLSYAAWVIVSVLLYVYFINPPLDSVREGARVFNLEF